jgi:hypothetical protein
MSQRGGEDSHRITVLALTVAGRGVRALLLRKFQACHDFDPDDQNSGISVQAGNHAEVVDRSERLIGDAFDGGGGADRGRRDPDDAGRRHLGDALPRDWRCVSAAASERHGARPVRRQRDDGALHRRFAPAGRYSGGGRLQRDPKYLFEVQAADWYAGFARNAITFV